MKEDSGEKGKRRRDWWFSPFAEEENGIFLEREEKEKETVELYAYVRLYKNDLEGILGLLAFKFPSLIWSYH